MVTPGHDDDDYYYNNLCLVPRILLLPDSSHSPPALTRGEGRGEPPPVVDNDNARAAMVVGRRSRRAISGISGRPIRVFNRFAVIVVLVLVIVVA